MPLRIEESAELYLELIKKCLTRSVFPDNYGPVLQIHPRADRQLQKAFYPMNIWLVRVIYPTISRILARHGLKLYMYRDVVADHREQGLDWPLEAETMVGNKRLDNLHSCIKSVLSDEIPGDFIETGVWRGGCCIFMRAALKAYGDTTRKVCLADSFEGMPKPDDCYPQDAEDEHWMLNDYLSVSLEQVVANFDRYGLLDDQVLFLKGWFKDSLSQAPIERLSILRLDGDLYASTMDSLTNLYPKLSPGGYVIIDDYGEIQGCAQAVNDYRRDNHITIPVMKVDTSAIYWRKDVA